jgi:hypothetical protein
LRKIHKIKKSDCKQFFSNYKFIKFAIHDKSMCASLLIAYSIFSWILNIDAMHAMRTMFASTNINALWKNICSKFTTSIMSKKKSNFRKSTFKKFACNFFVWTMNIDHLLCILKFQILQSDFNKFFCRRWTHSMQILQFKIACKRNWFENTKSIKKNENTILKSWQSSTFMQNKHFLDCAQRAYSIEWWNWERINKCWKTYCIQYLMKNILFEKFQLWNIKINCMH